jgi:hypothetical protein
MDAPPWTRVQADRWRAALPPWWLPAPELLGAVLLLVLVGGVIPLDAIEDGTQRTLYLLALSTTLVIVALLTRGARVALQRRRARQAAIAWEVAGSALGLWRGPPPDPGRESSPFPNLRALSSSRRQHQHRLPLPITTMCVHIDATWMLLYATDDPSPVLRISFLTPGDMLEGVDWYGDPADEELEAEEPADAELEGPSPAGRMMATVYGPPQLGVRLGAVVSWGRHPVEDLGVAAGIARRAPRTRLGVWLTRWVDQVRVAWPR